MGRPKAKAGQAETSLRLLDAAVAAFGGHSFGAVKLADIAKEAGITRPSLLYHYKSKQLLYSAVVRRVFSDLGQALTDTMARPADFVARVEAIFTRFSAFLRGRPHAARIVMREVLDEQGPGRQLLLEAGVPVLEMVEEFMRREGENYLRPGLPLREALLQVVTAGIVRVAAGPLEAALWGEEDQTLALARLCLFKEAP